MQQLIAITATTASILLQNFTPLHKVLASEHRLRVTFPSVIVEKVPELIFFAYRQFNRKHKRFVFFSVYFLNFYRSLFVQIYRDGIRHD